MAVCADVHDQLNDVNWPQRHGAVVLALMVLDGFGSVDLEALFRSGHLEEVRTRGRHVIASFRRAGRHNQIEVPLMPLSGIVVSESGALTQGVDVAVAKRDAMRWILARYPMLPWPNDLEQTFGRFHEMCRRAWRHHVQALWEVCAAEAVDAATPSRNSMLRLGAPAIVGLEPLAPSVNAQLTRRRPSVLVQVIVRRVNEAASGERLGEDPARRAWLLGKLTAMDTVSDPWATMLRDWLVEECVENGKPDGWSPLAPASLATYLQGPRLALVTCPPPDSFRSLPPAAWHAMDSQMWHEDAGGEADPALDEEQLEQLRVHWRRFLRTLSLAGYPIPPELLKTDSAREDNAYRARAAASRTLVLAQDSAAVRVGTMRAIGLEPLGMERAELASTLLDMGLRRSEIAALSRRRVCTDVQAILVSSEGYSHLKSEAAWRLICLDDTSFASLKAFAHALGATPGRHPFFFLGPDEHLHDFNPLAQVLTAWLVAATGDPEARLHSARAGAVTELHAPGWEALARAALQGRLSQAEVTAARGVTDLKLVGGALVESGHAGVLTPAVHYLSVWPLVRHVWLRGAFDRMPPSSALLRRLGSYQSYHKAKSRSSADAWSGWDWLCGSTSKLTKSANATTSPTGEEAVDATVPIGPPTADCNSVALMRLGLALALGEGRDIAAEGLDLPGVAVRFVASKVAGLSLTSVDADENPDPASRPWGALRRMVRSAPAASLIGHLLERPEGDLAALRLDLAAGRRGDKAWPGARAPSARLARHLESLPASFGARVTFQKHVSRDTQDALFPMGERLELSRPDPRIGTFPRMAIRPTQCAGNLVMEKRWTQLVRLALAVMALIPFQQPSRQN